jgi:hypothetical protein
MLIVINIVGAMDSLLGGNFMNMRGPAKPKE